jgi:transcriptional regulator with XRE-family HTH domain
LAALIEKGKDHVERKMVGSLSRKRKPNRKSLTLRAAPAAEASVVPPEFRIIGTRLRQARRSRDMTQSFAGDKLKVTHSTVGQWELHRTLPDVPHLIAAAGLYKVSLDWCCGMTEGADLSANNEQRVRQLILVLQRLITTIHHETLELDASLPPQTRVHSLSLAQASIDKVLEGLTPSP